MILDDIRRDIAAARRARAGKSTVIVDALQAAPRLVVLVGNRHAYAAARTHEADRALTDAELATFDGCDVEFGGCVGVEAVWRA